MIRAVNTVFAVALAAAITFILFFLMQLLIASDLTMDEREERTRIADITLPQDELEIQRVTPKPDRPEEIEQLPDLPEPEFNPNAPSTDAIAIQKVQVNLDGLDSNIGISASDAEYLPIVTVPPQYPQRAAQRGIEGWCLVSFTVNEVGGVEDVVVVDAEPEGMFDRETIRAVQRYKYNPRTEDGEPVKTYGVQQLLRFTLAD